MIILRLPLKHIATSIILATGCVIQSPAYAKAGNLDVSFGGGSGSVPLAINGI